MKKTITILAAVLLTANVFAQAPQKMTYQTVIRNTSNTLVASTLVGIQISILQGTSTGTAAYIETQTPTTNINGLATVEIGNGTIVSGSFSTINWAAGPYFVKTDIDPAGGNTYSIHSTSQLNSVPYALNAASGGTAYTSGTGIQIASNVITNTAPDQTVVITGTGGIIVSGTYPTFSVTAPGGSLVPAGSIIAFGGTAPPTGYFICDGSAISRTTYAALYTAIANNWGDGDASTTFNLPDLRGRFTRGVDGAAGNDPDKATRTTSNTGGNTGNLVGSIEADAFASHTHNENQVYAAVGSSPAFSPLATATTTNGQASPAPYITTAVGGNETRPKNANVNYIIKY